MFTVCLTIDLIAQYALNKYNVNYEIKTRIFFRFDILKMLISFKEKRKIINRNYFAFIYSLFIIIIDNSGRINLEIKF